MGLSSFFKLSFNQFPNIPLGWLVRECFKLCKQLMESDIKEKKGEKKDEAEVDPKMNLESDEDDESYDEEQIMEEKSFEYQDPFESVSPVLELKKIWQDVEQKSPESFQAII